MMDCDQLLALDFPEVQATHSVRDTILYALGLGLGADPTDLWQLRFVTETNIVALPTMAMVLGIAGDWIVDFPTGIDHAKVVDGERSLILHREIPVEGVTRSKLRIVDIQDKGPGRGALIHVCRDLKTADGAPIATMTQTVFARGDGGFGGPPGRSTGRRELPDRSPDRIHRWTTIPQQALIYRLSGDYNPLHADPNIAWKAGFKRPILHGLATFGISALAIIDVLCGGDPTKLRAISGRFSAPVYPGNTLRTDIWLEADSILFQTVIEGSKGIAVSNGIASITLN